MARMPTQILISFALNETEFMKAAKLASDLDEPLEEVLKQSLSISRDSSNRPPVFIPGGPGGGVIKFNGETYCKAQ